MCLYMQERVGQEVCYMPHLHRHKVSRARVRDALFNLAQKICCKCCLFRYV
jgi:hypothetical protein